MSRPEYEVNGHPFVPDGKTEFCARDTYKREDHNPHPIHRFTDAICGQRFWPYSENNICLLAPHNSGNHRGGTGKESPV